jgi:UDP-glucose 4-epimerase
MKLQSKNILVTGGAGFIGSHLVDALLEWGAKVVVVDNLSTGRKENINPKAKFYKLDINSSAFENVFKKHRPEIVYMLAFNTNVPKSVREPLFDAQSVTGSLKTLEFSKKYGVKKVVFSSTSFVYGNTKHLPTPETEPAMPENPYIISKHTVENYVQFYGKTYGLDFVIFRYATTYGPRQTGGAMADYIRCIHSGKQADIYGDGSKTRDYMYVGDIVQANLLAATYKAPKGILPLFNLSTGKETSLYSLYKKLAVLLGKPKAEPKFQPDRSGEMYRSKLDNSKAKKYFKWQPKISLDEGLKNTVSYFLNHIG